MEALVVALGIVFSWLPEKLNLLEGMALGAGFGAAFTGLLGLALKVIAKTDEAKEKIELESFIIVGTVAGVAGGALVVVAGNLKLHLSL
jgi:hypothetical protein